VIFFYCTVVPEEPSYGRKVLHYSIFSVGMMASITAIKKVATGVIDLLIPTVKEVSYQMLKQQ